VSEDIPIRVVGLRRFVTLCKIAPYRNNLTFLLIYHSSPCIHYTFKCSLVSSVSKTLRSLPKSLFHDAYGVSPGHVHTKSTSSVSCNGSCHISILHMLSFQLTLRTLYKHWQYLQFVLESLLSLTCINKMTSTSNESKTLQLRR